MPFVDAISNGLGKILDYNHSRRKRCFLPQLKTRVLRSLLGDIRRKSLHTFSTTLSTIFSTGDLHYSLYNDLDNLLNNLLDGHLHDPGDHSIALVTVLCRRIGTIGGGCDTRRKGAWCLGAAALGPPYLGLPLASS